MIKKQIEKIILYFISDYLKEIISGLDVINDQQKEILKISSDETKIYREMQTYILHANQISQLQAMFIESKNLKNEFREFIEKHGYKYKNDNKQGYVAT